MSIESPHDRLRRRVLVAVLLVGTGLAAVLAWRGSGGEDALEPHAERRAAAAERAAPTDLADLPRAPAGGIEVGRDYEWKQLGRSYDGTCTISGVVEVVAGVTFPQRWTLVIEPSRFGKGGEHATRRVREFGGDVRTFEETDLPMGGYTVSVKAPGRNCRPQEVLLFKVEGHEHLAGKDRVHLVMFMTGAGFLDGAVRDEAGVPVEGLPVVLEEQNTRVRTTTTTSSAGIWRFDDVLDGRYKLFLGDPNRPLLPPEDVTFLGPEHRHPDQVVPVTASVSFAALDEGGLPLPDVHVRGFGGKGGSVDVHTDGDGLALARFLPAGSYEVRASDRTGRSARTSFVLAGDEVEHRIELRCTPRR